MANDWFTRVFGHPLVRIWSYRSTFFVFMALFIGFSSVVPIDAISQASQSDNNYALNTFVVVGALVLFGITATILASTRLYILRAALQDIPKRYIPIGPNDLPRGCSEMIEENLNRCDTVRALALQTPRDVKHPGMSGPDSELLPPLLKFDDAVRTVGMRLKWDRSFAGSDIPLPANLSFREIIAHIESKLTSTNSDLCREYVELYEEIRYSGKLITEEQFVSFMECSIDFIKDISANGEGSSLERLHYPPSVYSKLSDDPSRSSLRNRTQQSMSLHYSPTKALYNNARCEGDYEPTDHDFYEEALRRVTTGQSVMTTRTTGTTNYNPF